MNVQAHVFISGWVQGVGFRYWTKTTALKLGLTGWVRNLPDSRVEAIFEGPKERVEEMVERCQKGPIWTGDNEVKVEWKKARKEFVDFEIRK
jgi:acylphosphatase